MLTIVRLPPLPASADTAVDTESIYLLLIDERRQTGSASFLTLVDGKTS
ncbi:hypothetical protein [Klebsiella pneumoniae]|nr:hypothetical protein [Klebsiella pneumoniae]